MKEELAAKLGEYLAREDAWISAEDARLRQEAQAQEQDISQIER